MKGEPYVRSLKRVIDIFVAGGALVVLSPVMMCVAAAIILADGRPILFRQERVGRDSRPFTFLKFRSMAKDTVDRPSAEASQLVVTRVGRVIRRLNLDELPQLVNILRGDMSLVGPRPALPTQDRLCRLRAAAGVFACPPGLTGLAQVNAYDDMPEEEKADWDKRYVAGVSLWLDLRIILRTFFYLLRPPPTY